METRFGRFSSAIRIKNIYSPIASQSRTLEKLLGMRDCLISWNLGLIAETITISIRNKKPYFENYGAKHDIAPPQSALGVRLHSLMFASAASRCHGAHAMRCITQSLLWYCSAAAAEFAQRVCDHNRKVWSVGMWSRGAHRQNYWVVQEPKVHVMKLRVFQWKSKLTLVFWWNFSC